ncbi:AAA family ATPase [Streptococcus sobrinus]|uniref:AAA family ATPase n=1 Tax=Streptococcus sobrinus TaxID=1310 RepID=UPI0002FA2220|nr:ATP-dependent Clp protease ATP-binding subunit [Streptococcus sobrinus]
MADETEQTQSVLEEFADNLSAKVLSKPDDFEVYGRDEEVEDVILALLRKGKNSPVLIGEPGVGKTAVVEGLALKIARGQVPARLQGLTVYNLELSSLTGDGDFIAKFKQIIDELVDRRGEVLMFMDEIHTIVGAGGQEGQALDAGNVIKPVLARGEIQLIGATTLDEYHQYIETDKALERRMPPIMIDEPTEDEAITILNLAKAPYEEFHQVTYSEEAIRQAVSLSIRYITDKYLPDKAFDLIDEAGSLAASRKQTEITEAEIAEILKRKTGIPVTTILQGDSDRLEKLKEVLHSRVKGQDGAIAAVLDAVSISQEGLQDESKPFASFFLLGGSGTGKTELAKATAQGLFDSEEALIRFDMSEFKQKEDVTKLIGDSETKSKGKLTESVKHNPYSVLLFDEIEKADKDVLDLFLQVLDDGRITDATGRLINFKNTIIMMTTNLGAELISDQFEKKGDFYQLSEEAFQTFDELMTGELMNELRIEFLNRFDNKIIFNVLTKETILKIVGKYMDMLDHQLDKFGLTQIYDEAVEEYLADVGVDPVNGARPLARVITQKIKAPISRIKRQLRAAGSLVGYTISITVEDDFATLDDGYNHITEGRHLNFKVIPPKEKLP